MAKIEKEYSDLQKRLKIAIQTLKVIQVWASMPTQNHLKDMKDIENGAKEALAKIQ